jgi:hypothetical protein
MIRLEFHTHTEVFVDCRKVGDCENKGFGDEMTFGVSDEAGPGRQINGQELHKLLAIDEGMALVERSGVPDRR